MKRSKKKPHRFLHVLRNILFTLIALIALLYGVVYLGHKVFFPLPHSDKATIQPIIKDGFRLDAASHPQPKTMEAYLPVLASQVKHYNQHIDTYWPDNPQKNQYVITKAMDGQQAYLITPQGKISKLSQKAFDSYHFKTLNTDGQWSPFKKNGISGAYLPISVPALSNYYGFQKYYHLGTYDQFLSYSHELFHSITQENWAKSSFGSKNRDDRNSDTKGRRIRMLLMQQLSAAITDSKHQDAHIKDALATYNYYRKHDPKDYKAALLFDRLEGTAYYYELTSALYAAYPTQVKNQTQMYHALRLVLANDNPAYRANGVVDEAYNVGGYAGILLDQLALQNHQDPNTWKNEIVHTGNTTPLLLLEQQYASKKLPAAKAIPSQKAYDAWLAGKNKIDPQPTTTQNFFDLAYSILFSK